MNEFKWIVSDLDGTLIYHENHKKNIIYPEVITELHRAIKGKKFSIATGRHYKDVLDICQKFGIKLPNDSFVIGLNGCQIYSNDSQKLLLNKTLENNLIWEIIPKMISYLDERLPHASLIFAYGENENIYFIRNNSSNFDKMTQIVLEHEENNGIFKYLVVESVNELKNITKFCVYMTKDIDNPKDLTDQLTKISNEVDYAITGDNFLEIIMKNINKASALKHINDNFYHIDKKNVLVLGDAGNDLEMMEYAGTSVTRSDARPEIISKASKVYEGGPSIFVKNALADLIK